MLVKANFSKIKEVAWTQYAVRFILGGFITATAGILAEKYGPAVGGLFLAFPAIFPATVTLVEKTERAKKHERAMNGDKRARAAAALDAYGAALGSGALMVFALFTWLSIPRYSPWLILLAATAVWLICAVSTWAALRWRRHRSSRTNQRPSVA